MRQSVIALAVVALSACSVGLPSECDRVTTHGAGVLEYCASVGQVELWGLGMPYLLADLERYLPGVSEIASRMVVEVRDGEPDGKVDGEYYGYDETPARVLVLLFEGGNAEARYSALAHEWAHAWEHQARGVTESDASEPGDDHFGDGELIRAALSIVQTTDAEDLFYFPL